MNTTPEQDQYTHTVRVEHSELSDVEHFQAAQKVTWISVAVNVFLSLSQIVIGLFAKSQALLADGLHSLSDLVCDFLVIFANRHSRKEADQTHPYGHLRIENATTFILGVILFVLGLGLLWNAATKLSQLGYVAQQSVHPVALVTAILTLICKEGLFRYMLHVGNQLKSQMLIANAWHSRSDAASSVVVVVGIIGNLSGFTFLDLVAAVLVAFFITRMGWVLGYDALMDLIDRGLDTKDLECIEQTILETHGVCGLHELRSRKMGDHALIDAHILVDRKISVSEGHYIAESVRNNILKLKDLRILDIMVHIDPEDDSERHNVGMMPSREFLIAHLKQCFASYDLTFPECLHMTFHYLDGKVEAEIVLATQQNLQIPAHLIEKILIDDLYFTKIELSIINTCIVKKI